MSRDTQFSAFARNVVEELTQVHDGAIQYSDYWSEQAEQIIARRAYDLILHAIAYMPELISGLSDIHEAEEYMPHIPDMTTIGEQAVSKEYTIIVHTIAEDGLPPEDYEKAGLVGRVCFIFEASLYSGWPLRNEDETPWEDNETGKKFYGVKKWIELPVYAGSL